MAIGFVPEGQHDSSQARSAYDFDRPSGTESLYVDTQALRAWLLSACPSKTKAIQFLT
jgi:hypothetical protein